VNSGGYPGPVLAWQPHLRAVTDAARARADERAAALCSSLGYHLEMIGDYAGARPYFERTLAICEQVLGAEHPNTATSLNNLGGLLRAQGDYAGARPYYERALRIFCAALGEQHPSTQTVQNNLEALLAEGEGPQGQTEGAP
jgi:tetratricopeptide (TPR) repeat protein